MTSLIFDNPARYAHLSDQDMYRRFYSVDHEPGELSVARHGEPRLQWAVQNIPQNAKVLDVGCYKGSVAIPLWMQRSDLRITGVDISAPAIMEAVEFAEVLEAPIEFHVAMAEHLPFDDNTFDAVLLFEILEHVVDPHAVLVEARRVRTNSGVVLISSPVGAIELESHAGKGIPGFEDLRQHVREYDPAIELAEWPGLITERQVSPISHFDYYLAILR